jgi:hypothetical protein
MAVPDYLAWSGVGQTVELSSDDWRAMDVALALVPEARIAALAVSRAESMSIEYPITSTAQIASLLGNEDKLIAGGHEIDIGSIKRYVAAGELPIAHEGQLASVVYLALKRCTQRYLLEQNLRYFDAALDIDADEAVVS